MSNILNSQIPSIENPIPARNIAEKKFSRYVQAPTEIYSYSIDKALKEKDEFRKNVVYNQSKELNGKKSSFFPKACVILAALTAYFIHKCK